MDSFTAAIRNHAKTVDEKIADLVHDLVITAGELVDSRSPVGQPERWAVNIDRASRGLPPVPKDYEGGHFRANNQYTFGAGATVEVEGVDPSGTMALSAISSAVKAAPVVGVHYISNIVPYASALEHGHSPQAPLGIYGLAAIDLRNIAIEKIKAME